MEPTNSRYVALSLRGAAVAAALGLGLIGLFHDLPLRVLLWDEIWWSPVAEAMGYGWVEWVTSPEIDGRINLLGKGIGLVCLLAGGTMALTNRPRFLRIAVWVATIFLLMQQELPYSTEIEIMAFEETEEMARINATIHVSTKQHKLTFSCRINGKPRFAAIEQRLI